MPQPTLIQTAFNAGEVSPDIYGRVDLAKYANATKTMLNMVALLHGPATRRTGFEYIAQAKNPSDAEPSTSYHSRLVPFEFSTTQAYILEVGHLYIRFFKDGAAINHIGTITGASQANPCVITCAAGHRFVDNQYVTISGVGGMTELNGNEYKITYISGTQFSLDGVDSTGYGAYTAGGSATGIYEIASPYTSSESGASVDVDELDFAQSADTLYIAHEDYEPRTLTRTAHDNWTLDTIDFIDGPYDIEGAVDYAGITLTPSGTTGTITVTASAAVFASTDVGRMIGIQEPAGEWGTCEITVFGSSTSVTAVVIQTLDGMSASSVWKLGAWFDDQGYPKTVTFDKDRLAWAGSPTYPQTIWLSKVGLYTDYGTTIAGVVDDDGLSLILGAKKVNAIRWIESIHDLVLGTTSSEWWLTSATGAGAITANSKHAALASQNGSAILQPTIVGNSILYLHFHGKILHEMKYSHTDDSYVGDQLTILAEHLTEKTTIVSMAYQHQPHRILWCVRSDGVLLGLTYYYPSHDVIGWHRHTTDGQFESVAVIPGSTEDELWATVKRTVDGGDHRYVERLHTVFTGGTFDDTTDAFFVDSGLTYDGRVDISSINESTDVVSTDGNHGFSDGDMVRFRVEDDPDDAEDLDSLHLEQLEVSDKTSSTFKCKDADGNYIDFSDDYLTIKSKYIFTAGDNTVAKDVTSITGLDHLEGETVSILADGGPVPDQAVTSGALTLSTAASVVHAGLPYDSDLETLNPEIQTQTSQTSQGMTKRIPHVTLRLRKSLGAKLGPDEDNLRTLSFVDDSVPLNQPGNLFTGDKMESFKGTYDTDVSIFLRQDQPLPLTLLALIYEVELEEE